MRTAHDRWEGRQMLKLASGATTRRVLACLCFCGVFGTASAHADPFTFFESVSGDLPTPTIFTFDVGVNTIGGSLGFGVSQTADFDSFAFAIPQGTALTSVSYWFRTNLSPDVAQAGSEFALLDETGVELASVSILGLAPTPPLGSAGLAFMSALPVQSGIYYLSHFSMLFRQLPGTPPAPGTGFTQDYIWRFGVTETAAPVPEPASVTLVVLSLAGWGARQWRHRRPI